MKTFLKRLTSTHYALAVLLGLVAYSTGGVLLTLVSLGILGLMVKFAKAVDEGKVKLVAPDDDFSNDLTYTGYKTDGYYVHGFREDD